VTSKTNLAMTVETSKEIPVQIALVWSRGKRVDQISRGDIVASSGVYNYGLALTEVNQLKPGLYTAVVSTFDVGRIGDFQVHLQSDQVIQCTEIPAEGAGKYHQQVRHRWNAESAQGSPKHSQYFSNPTYEVKVDRSCLFCFRLLVAATLTQPRPPINVAVFHKATRREVVSSGPYADAVCGVAIEECRLQPGDYLVVVSTYEAGITANFTLEMYSDRRIVYQKVAG
jgi:calpain-7